MKKYQAIQILQFSLIRVFLFFFTSYVLKISFINFILEHRFLVIIYTISYFYYYSLQYSQEKKHIYIKNFLLYWNLYLFLHVFFRPLLNISHELFILLWILIFWLRFLSKQNIKWKKTLQIIDISLCFLILISWFFYLYPEAPDIQGFKDNRNDYLFISWNQTLSTDNAKIQIKTNKKDEIYEISPFFSKTIEQDCQISYLSTKTHRTEFLWILTNEGNVLLIYPQTQITIKTDSGKIKDITANNWSVFFKSGLLITDTIYSWKNWDINEEINQIINNKQKKYSNDLIKYLKDQISKNNISSFNNTTIHNINWYIIKILANIFPTFFQQNLDNYNQFQFYFSLNEEKILNYDKYQLNNSWISTKFTLSQIKDNINIKNKSFLFRKK